MITDFLNSLESISPHICWDALCAVGHAFNSALALPSCLRRALRLARGESVGPSQVSAVQVQSLGQEHSPKHPYAVVVSQVSAGAFQSFCKHLILQLFLLNFLVSLKVYLLSTALSSLKTNQFPQMLPDIYSWDGVEQRLFTLEYS